MDRASLVRLLSEAAALLEKEPPLIKLEPSRALIVGDTHGDLDTTLNALREAADTGAVLVFLGDYVDRGPKQLENIERLLEEKLARPDKVFLLRGNHETKSMNLGYGFYELVSKRLGEGFYAMFAECFANMAYAALLNKDVLCVHGGIAEPIRTVEQIGSLPKEDMDIYSPAALQLLWNDPDEHAQGFGPSPRGPGAMVFGEDVFSRFVEANGLRLLVRSHEPQPEGYGYLFHNRLLTVFSCRYYGVPPCGALLEEAGVKIVRLE